MASWCVCHRTSRASSRYAFGHDLYRVSSKFLAEHGGVNLGNDMVPTNTLDYSSYILKLRTIKPDLIYLNLAGTDQTSFLKQYREFGSPFPLAGGVMDTVPFWAAGIDPLSGYWQSLWYHDLKESGSPEFTATFTKRNGKPPDNQAWGEYVGIRIALQAIAETKSTGARTWPRTSRRAPGSTSSRAGRARSAKMRDQWDIFDIVEAQPTRFHGPLRGAPR